MAKPMMSLDEHKARTARSYKLLLAFAMVSITMMFAGLTSAYVVSASRGDWMREFSLPGAFTISTILIILCSLTIHLAKLKIKADDRKATTLWLWATLVLGLAFVYFQFRGFDQIVEGGHFFTGSASSITTTFIYVIAIAHLAHLFGGILSLVIVIYNHFKQKYSASQPLGIELAGMYWHFLDILWIYLFLFLSFYK